MYDELIAELRQHHCDAKEDDTQEVCDECAYDVIIADKSAKSGIASVCVCGLMNRAADAIEELSKPRWIPVTERLPEKGYYVLAYEDDDILMASYADGNWVLRDMYEIIDDLKPTHWMPLPSTEGLNET